MRPEIYRTALIAGSPALIGNILDLFVHKVLAHPEQVRYNDFQRAMNREEANAMKTGSIVPFAAAVVLAVFANSVCAGGTYSGGTGEPNDPYRIATANDLNDIGNHSEDRWSHFVMVNDVNLADYNGTQFNIIGSWSNPFAGVFDGNGHTVFNFTYECNNTNYVGLFGVVDEENAEIRDVALVDPNVDGGNGDSIGALVGRLETGGIIGCRVNGGKVSGGGYVGGLVGDNTIGAISNCQAMTCVSGHSQTGGLVGYVSIHKRGTVLNCWSRSSVRGDMETGGLVGANFGHIWNCCASGVVEGTSSRTGGLVGCHWYGMVSNSYFTGQVSGADYTGGLVGQNSRDIVNCYAAGPVDGNNNTGGLAGSGGHYTKCFWDAHVNPDMNGIGDTADPNVIGKPTAEMMQESTFAGAGWDFVEVWDIGENQTYPFLRVYPPGDLNHDSMVNFIDVAILADHWLESWD